MFCADLRSAGNTDCLGKGMSNAMKARSLAGCLAVMVWLSLPQTATQGRTTSMVAIRAMEPVSGPVGTPVTLTGAGFLSENVVLFGSGASQSAPSKNGSTLTFIVPAVLGPSCLEQGCRVLSQAVMRGRYPVVVRNANGTSNAMSFNVR